MRAKRPRFQAVCGSRARQGDGRSTAETPALPAGVRLAGETPALPGSVRLAGETGVGESDRRDARAPRQCAARGRDRGRGERPASRPRPQAVRGTRASHPRSQAVRGTRARQGDGRSTAETPAPPGGARHAGETGGREIDRRDACASSRGAARGRDRGTGDRPPRRLRFQPGCGTRARQGDGRSTAETPALPAGVRLAGETPALPGGAGTRSIPAYQDHSRTTPGCPDRNACYRSRCDIRRHPTDRSRSVSASVAATATGSV